MKQNIIKIKYNIIKYYIFIITLHYYKNIMDVYLPQVPQVVHYYFIRDHRGVIRES